MSLHISSTEGLRRLLQEALRTSSSSSTGHIEAWEGYLGSSDGDPIPYLAVRAAILAVSEHAKNSTAIEDTAESSKRHSSEASRVMSSGDASLDGSDRPPESPTAGSCCLLVISFHSAQLKGQARAFTRSNGTPGEPGFAGGRICRL